MRPLVYIPEPIALNGLNLLLEECDCLTPWREHKTFDISQNGYRFQDELALADAVMVRLLKVTEAHLRNAPQLKVIAKHGAGFDNIDYRAATRMGIAVVYTPHATTAAVAEHTIGMMLALSRRLSEADSAIRRGTFDQRNTLQGIELQGKTLSIIGLGRIGSRVAEIASRGFGMSVCAYDPFRQIKGDDLPEIKSSFAEVLQSGDFVSLHLPLVDETRHLINAKSLEMLRPSCRLINTSRGAIIDQSALIDALHSGRLAGAALDVFEEEPLPADHPLCKTPNTLLTPHTSSATSEALERMSIQAAEGILDVLNGRPPSNVINPEVLSWSAS
jgi:D-3-phosphoglycerate dehydrogenase